MRPISKSVLSAVLGLSLMVPVMANAAGLTTNQVSAIVSLLQSFGADAGVVSNVQVVLSGQPAPNMGTSTMTQPPMHGDDKDKDNDKDHHQGMGNGGMPPGQMSKMACLSLSRDLGPGSHGDDVKQLQQLLSDDKDTGFNAQTTGVFGPATSKAMRKFQLKNGIASSGTGKVGTMTRSFFERSCGKGLTMGSTTSNSGDQNGHMPMPVGVGMSGTITAVSTSSITVQNRDGKSVMVFINSSTTIKVFTPPATSTNSTSTTTTPPQPPTTPPTPGTISDLMVGKIVSIEGTVLSEGTVTARNIMVGLVLPSLPPQNWNALNTQNNQENEHGGQRGPHGDR